MTPQRKYNLPKTIAELAGIVLIVIAAKTAIAEPFYVPSGSMEPTLLIGDELLATKYPYGYGTASLPSYIPEAAFIWRPPNGGIFVFFGYPGDRAAPGQARDRPARRSHRAAQWPRLDQRRRGRN